MIIKGLDNIVKYLEDQHLKKVDDWCKQKGLPPLMAREVRRQYWLRQRLNQHSTERH